MNYTIANNLLRALKVTSIASPARISLASIIYVDFMESLSFFNKLILQLRSDMFIHVKGTAF